MMVAQSFRQNLHLRFPELRAFLPVRAENARPWAFLPPLGRGFGSGPFG